MKILLRFIALSFCILSLHVFADVWVEGYTKRNGAYVPGHYRSSPNSTQLDNYSYQGNVNPYTGKIGTKRKTCSGLSLC
jgi:hypothetical protein